MLFGAQKKQRKKKTILERLIAKVPLTAEEESDLFAVKKKAYDLALCHILVGAHERGLIPAVSNALRPHVPYTALCPF
jgi:hypothetical protein